MTTIIFVIPSLKTGGGNRVFFELANRLISRYNINIIFPNNNLEGNSFYIDKNINIFEIGGYSNNRINKIINLFKTFTYLNKKHRNDTIIISDPLVCLLLWRIKSKKNVYRFLQADDYKIFDDMFLLKNIMIVSLYKMLCKCSYKEKVHYIFNSRFVYEQFIQDSGRDDVSYANIHPAINHAIFYNKNYIIKGKELNIGLVGRKHPLKGLQTFIDMYHKLDDSIRSRIHNVYIISHDDLSKLDIKYFTIINPKSDLEIADIYNKCSIFISTSWWEGFGLPGLEAMACGCALITSDSGGCREYAVNAKNALFFTPKSVEELYSVFINLLNNTKLIQELSENGKKQPKNFLGINQYYN